MAGSLAFWYRTKYGLPPTDPRFLDVSVEDMLTERFAYHYRDNPNAENDVVDDSFDLQKELEDDDFEEI